MAALKETVPVHEAGHPAAGLGNRMLFMAALLGVLHLLVALPHFAVRLMTGTPAGGFPGIRNFARVTDRLWRGSAPTAEGYRSLADAGIASVIDLRAEADVPHSRELATAAAISVVHVPIRDGQTPSAAQIDELTETIVNATGAVFVHCQAGVGRTGSVVAALRVADGESPRTALVEALRFGPLSLEQQVFVLRCDRPDASLLPAVIASRIVDSPRRLWSRLKS